MESLRPVIQHVGIRHSLLAICLVTFTSDAASPPGPTIHDRCHVTANEFLCSRAQPEDVTAESFEVPIESFRCDDCEMAQLDDELFRHLQNASSVFVRGATIARMSETTFRNLTGLTELTITNTTIRFLPEKTFERTELLERLDLRSNRLAAIAPQQFGRSSELRALLLSRNEISRLDADTFRSVAKLERLELDENPLSLLPDNLFEGLRQLRSLNASKCRLSAIGKRTFSGADGLVRLDLSANGIASIGDSAFRSLGNLTVLNLSDNRLTNLSKNTFEGLHSLQELYVQNNRLTHLEFGLFKPVLRLAVLNISCNSFKYISTDNIFANLSSLEVLDISRNLPTLFAQTIFSSVSNVRVITMDEPTLHKQGFKNLLGDLKALEMVRLYNYSWSCSKLDNFRTYLKSRNIEFRGFGLPRVDRSNETCVEPDSVSNSSLEQEPELEANRSKPTTPERKRPETPAGRTTARTTAVTASTKPELPTPSHASRSTTVGPLKFDIGLPDVATTKKPSRAVIAPRRHPEPDAMAMTTTTTTNKILERLDAIRDLSESSFALQIAFVVLVSIVLVLTVGVIVLLRRKSSVPGNDARSASYVDDAHMELLAS